MKRNTLRILSIVLVAIMLIASVSTIVLAEGSTKASELNARDMYDDAADTTQTTKVLNTMIGNVITVVQIIGIGVAIVMLIVLAIKYISAAPGDKAEIKKHAVVYVVGAIVLFAASGIIELIKQFAGAFNEVDSSGSAEQQQGN